jgi:hypothetical protein
MIAVAKHTTGRTEVSMTQKEFDERFNRLAARQTRAMAEGVAYILAAVIRRFNDGIMVIDDLKLVLEGPELHENPVAGFLLSQVVRHFDGLERSH